MIEEQDLDLRDSEDIVSETKKESPWLGQGDIPSEGLDATIAKAGRALVTSNGQLEEKTVSVFVEKGLKPWIMNSTNVQIVAKIAKSKRTKDWVGVRLHLLVRDDITYKGEVTGGIRAEAPRKQEPPPRARARKAA